jgi:hypothetical protein
MDPRVLYATTGVVVACLVAWVAVVLARAERLPETSPAAPPQAPEDRDSPKNS